MRKRNKEKQREYDRAYRMTDAGILNTRAHKKRYYLRLKEDPERMAHFKEYHRQYGKIWEEKYTRVWQWSLKNWKWMRVRIPAPLPRYEEIPEWGMPDES